MEPGMIWEIIGYIGSALVLVSLLMTSILKLRIINAVGCVVFSVYAFVINSIPTALMNVALFVIDVFFLIKLLRAKSKLTYVKASAEDPVLKHFFELFSEDIAKYFDISGISAADFVLVVFDGETVAGVTAGVTEGGDLRLIMDYTTPQYRDCKVGAFLYDELAGSFLRLIYKGSNEKHIAYCEKMGYIKQGTEYVKLLAKKA